MALTQSIWRVVRCVVPIILGCLLALQVCSWGMDLKQLPSYAMCDIKRPIMPLTWAQQVCLWRTASWRERLVTAKAVTLGFLVGYPLIGLGLFLELYERFKPKFA